ncbi:cbb3-type cytochrome c oxidase N-terminal domain-containing protein [Flavobacterium sp.]|jgi:cytochrome c oxidase cbb3-type subunit 3|uniref:cbb3-type cytochrome c oxidase N-terminal domain-containing protein n=1 Tax=Flavobacterium sp. TaxID=239 RepID=UPI0037C156C4
MRKLIPVYVRIPLLYALMFGVLEYFIDSGDRPALVKYPVVALFHVVFIFLLIAIEVVLNSVDKVTYQLLSEEEKAKLEADKNKPLAQQEAFKNWMRKLTASRSINEEKDMLLDHDYDGIKELDNVLPPWWVGLFYATVIFALVYLVRFHIMGDYNQDEEFVTEMKIADAKVEEYKKTAPDLMDKEKVTLLTDASAIAAGKTLFDANCVACHRPDGGGAIGPNLTDKFWINGGGIKNVFNTIMEGGRPGKGMVPWKESIKPSDIQKIASYVLSLQGTNPKDPKPTEPEAKEWKEDGASAPATETPATVAVDSTAKK